MGRGSSDDFPAPRRHVQHEQPRAGEHVCAFGQASRTKSAHSDAWHSRSPTGSLGANPGVFAVSLVRASGALPQRWHTGLGAFFPGVIKMAARRDFARKLNYVDSKVVRQLPAGFDVDYGFHVARVPNRPLLKSSGFWQRRWWTDVLCRGNVLASFVVVVRWNLRALT